MTRLPTPRTGRHRRWAPAAAAAILAALTAACSSPLGSAVHDLQAGTSTPSASSGGSTRTTSSSPSTSTWTTTRCALSEAALQASSPGDWSIDGPDSEGVCTYVNDEDQQIATTSLPDDGDAHAVIAGMLLVCSDAKPAPSVDPDAYTCLMIVESRPVLTGIVKRPGHVVMLHMPVQSKTPTAKELALLTGWLKAVR